jgi:hypothetical protein
VQLLNTKLDEAQPLRKDVPGEKQLMAYLKLYGYDVKASGASCR